MSEFSSFYRRNQAKSLIVAFVIVAACVSQFLLFATPHKNSDKLHSSAATCTISAILVNSCRPWDGASPNDYPGVNTSFQARIADYEARTNSHVDVVHAYEKNAATLSADEKYFINRANTYALISYKPSDSVSWAQQGGSNATVNTNIKNFADSIKSVAPKKVFVSIWHEPENDVQSGAAGCAAGYDYKGGKGTPAQYRAMWQNVRNIFNAEGVSNAVWSFVMQSGSQWDCMQKEMWPGNGLVDWVMWDHYYNNSETFATGTSRMYNWLSSNTDSTHNYTSHPYGIAEWGSWQDNQSDVYKLYVDGGNALKNNTYPNLKLWLIWDSVGQNDSRVKYTGTGALDNAEQTSYNTNWAQNPVFTNNGTTPPPAGDTTKPSVTITSPASGSTVSSSVVLNVTASDNVAVTRVTLYWDSTHLIRDGTSQGTYGWGSSWNSANASNGAHTITATAYDAAGNSQTYNLSLTVNNGSTPPPAPVINSFTASPTTVTVGQSTTITWSSTNAVSCSVNTGGPQNVTSTTWSPLAYTTVGSVTYTLVCKNSAGTTVSKTLTITVNPAPTPPTNVTLNASKTSIQTGSSVSLSWSSSGSSSCTLNPGNFSASGSSSSKTLTPTSTTTYKVTCTNTAGSTNSNSVTVTVTSTPPPPANPVIGSFVATPSSIAYGGGTVLSWQASNVVTGGCSLTPSSLSSTNGSGTLSIPSLTASASYTLSCHNSANVSVSKSVSVVVAGQPAPTPPPATPPASVPTTPTTSKVTAPTGQSVDNTQVDGTVTQGALVTLDASNITDAEKVKDILKVEFYSGDELIQTVTKAPFALDSGKAKLKAGTYNFTQRTYYIDGSMSQQSQIVTIKAKSVATKSNGARIGIVLLVIVAIFTVGAFAIHRWFNRTGRGSSGPSAGNDLAPTIISPSGGAS